MANLGLLETLIRPMPEPGRRVLADLLRHLVPNIEFGPVAHQLAATNLRGITVVGLTASSTGEFSVLHGLGRAPYRAMPAIDLLAVGAQLVPLEVTRAADTQRIYLKSTTVNAEFALYVE